MKYENQQHLLRYSLSEQLTHGMQVSNLAYEVAKGIGAARKKRATAWRWPACFMISEK